MYSSIDYQRDQEIKIGDLIYNYNLNFLNKEEKITFNEMFYKIKREYIQL